MSCGIVDDIEDILKTNESGSVDEVDRLLMANKSFVLPKSLKKLQKSNEDTTEEINADSIIPGTAKIYIKT
jgi:hypothetical protein